MKHPANPVPGSPSEQLFSGRKSEIADQVTKYIFSLPDWQQTPIAQLQYKADVLCRFLESAKTFPEDVLQLVDRVVPKWEAVRLLETCWSRLFQEMEDEPSWEELQAWKVLLHAREYLEAQR